MEKKEKKGFWASLFGKKSAGLPHPEIGHRAGREGFSDAQRRDADAGGPKTPKVPPAGTGQNLRDELGGGTAAPYNTQLKK